MVGRNGNMVIGAGVCTLLLILSLTHGTHAQTIPRDPLGSNSTHRGAIFDQVPGGLAESNDSVRIMNQGNQALFVAFWNGTGAWQNVTLPAGRLSIIKCPACGATISIAFNNGQTAQTVGAAKGSDYVMSWSDQVNAWDLKPAP